MDVFTIDKGTWFPLDFAPDYQVIVNVSYSIARLGLTLDYTMNLTGSIKLPEYELPFDRAAYSPVFSIHKVQITNDFALPEDNIIQACLAFENIFGYTQPPPLVDPQNPFGDNFDTAYVYGPIQGGHIGFEMRYTLKH